MTREATGPHPVPPLLRPPADSEPPISPRGASWKAIGAALAVLLGIIGSTLTISYQIGLREAEQRARDATQSEQLDEQGEQLKQVARDVRVMRDAQLGYREQLSAHRERLQTLRRDVDVNGREIRELNKRRDRRNN